MIFRSPSDIPKILEILNSYVYWTYDVETTGLSTRKDKIVGFGCCRPDTLQAFYLITHEYVNGELVELITKEQLSPIIESLSRKRLLGWNFAFDSSITLTNYGVDLLPALHTEVMLMVHSCDENLPNYGLKVVGSMLFGSDAGAAKEEMKESIKANGGGLNEFYKSDSNLLAKYGIQDNILTAKIFNHYKPILRSQGLEQFFYQDEVLPLYKTVTVEMQRRGVPVDLPLLRTSLAEISSDLKALEAEIQTEIAPHLDLFNAWYMDRHYPVKLTGPFIQKFAEQCKVNLTLTKTGSYSLTASNIEKLEDCRFKQVYLKQARMTDAEIRKVQASLYADSGQLYAFNILSKDHLKRLFFTKLNETPLSRTDKGSPQVDDDFLDLMSKKYSWAAKLRTFNRLTKINGTYIERILEEQEDGIFYPSFAQHRTVSGRYGSDFQQLPRPLEAGQAEDIILKYNNRIRRFFVAGPGYKFVDDDYESLEPHVFAHVSGDPGLISIFNNGHDFYSTIAIATEGLHEYSADKKAPNYLGKLNKAARQKAKAYSLGLAYGMSGYKLAFELEIPQSEAERLVNNYLNAYPKLKAWMNHSRTFACANGYMKVESGRIRRFPELKRLYAQHGDEIFDSLALWKKYNETPDKYEQMKDLRRRAVNYVNNASNVQIQGLASSIVNRACIAIARELRGTDAYICAQIHDEIVVRCPDIMVEQVSQIVQNQMEGVYKLSLALKAPPSSGTNLAEAKG
jgi:DNA polymerase I-like protein with 3'-5' exonuclease and polymerase domains